MTPVEYKQIKETLKKVLKNKQLTYADLAKKMKTSEVTIKRFFSDDKYSSKIFEICEKLSLSFYDLVEMSRKKKKTHFELTEDQDAFFVKHLGQFAIFRELYRKKTVSNIQKRWKLNDRQMFKVLMDLEKLGLIEVYGDNKVKIVPHGIMELKRHSSLEVLLRKKLTVPFLELFESYYPEDAFYHNSEVEMGEETRQQMVKELREFFVKYCTLAMRDKTLLSPKEIHSVRWLACFAQYKTSWEDLKPF